MRIMVCITMDAHNRDCVRNKLVLFNITDVTSFQWQSQLKHKWRKPPKGASFVTRDTHLRGALGERAEVAICDAIVPYDYEYLGNGYRLVITPLTDRICASSGAHTENAQHFLYFVTWKISLKINSRKEKKNDGTLILHEYERTFPISHRFFLTISYPPLSTPFSFIFGTARTPQT